MAKAGMCTIGFGKKPVTAALDIAARAGADGVEIWGRPDHIRYPLDSAQIREVREHAESLALEICCLGSYFQAGAATEYAGVKLDARNQVRLARELGTSMIRIWAGTASRAATPPETARKVIEDIRVFADHAADARIQVVLERHHGSLTEGWDGVKELLSEIAHPDVFLNWQIVGGEDEEELATRGVADYTALLPLSRHAHMHNYTAMDDGSLKRCYLDAGIVDYKGLASVARTAGYRGYFMVEFPPELTEGLGEVESIRRDIDFLRSLK